jgi:hypothetical protein
MFKPDSRSNLPDFLKPEKQTTVAANPYYQYGEDGISS